MTSAATVIAPSGSSAATHPCRLRLIPTEPAGPTTPRIWFAILTYNALAYTKRCLASLDLHTAMPWHAVILDNTSTDGTREWLATLDDSRITVALSATNRGVAGGRNDLLDLVMPRVPDDGFVVFVDNDLEFYPQWTTPFMELFERQPTAGMASVSGHEIVIHDGRRELLSLPGHATTPVDVASGGFACFVRPGVFRQIGRYDEELNPFWHEDDDISVRAKVAGWRVYAVPTAGVVHHGHKSGAALPSLIQGGSLSKQQYLVEKWRALGIVAADGRLQCGRPDPDDALLARLGARLARPSLRQSEAGRASFDLALLANLLARTGSIVDGARYVSAPAKALLEDRLSAAPSAPADQLLHAAMQQLLDARRRASRLSPVVRKVGESAPLELSRLADAANWDDPEWFANAVQFAGDGRGAQQWYDRSLTTWRATQSAHVLRTLDLLRPDARLLVVGDLRSPLVWGLARTVGAIVVADTLERYAGGGTPWLHEPERFARQVVPAGRVRAVDLTQLLQEVGEGSMDAALVLPWDNAISAADTGALLSLVATRVVPGGPLLSCVRTRLAGPPQPGVLESPAAAQRWLAGLGLQLHGALDLRISDAGLLAATDIRTGDARIPNLLVGDGASLVGNLFVTAVRAPIRPNASI